MTAPAINMAGDMPMPKEVQQQDTMRTMRFTDQHGRRYTAVVSNKTLDPCGAMTPDGWSAPLPTMVPPTKYFTFDAAEVGRTVIDYDRWILDIGRAEKDYGVWVLERAKMEYGAAALQKIESRDHGLRMLCGPPPQSSEYIKAMKAGNPWVLGLRKPDGSAYRRPSWAEEFFDGWVFESTFDGSDVSITVDPSLYPSADEDALDIADRLARAEQYADAEEDADPTAQRVRAPIPRSHKRKEPTNG